jgi:hypothetical protein
MAPSSQSIAAKTVDENHVGGAFRITASGYFVQLAQAATSSHQSTIVSPYVVGAP